MTARQQAPYARLPDTITDLRTHSSTSPPSPAFPSSTLRSSSGSGIGGLLASDGFSAVSRDTATLFNGAREPQKGPSLLVTMPEEQCLQRSRQSDSCSLGLSADSSARMGASSDFCC